MPNHALAIANNDVVHIAWSVDHPIPTCTGFSIWRVPANGKGPEVPLQVLLTFVSEPPKAAKPGTQDKPIGPDKPQSANARPALIKGFKWRDLLTTEQRGIAVKYRIEAMCGPEASPVPIPDLPPIWTGVVTPTPHFGDVDAYFNRGILSTQALAKLIRGKNGKPNVTLLQDRIAQRGSKVRTMLAGELEDAVQTLLAEREITKGEIYAALYELTDDTLIKRLEAAGDKLHIVLSNNTGDKKKAYDAANAAARKRLAKSGADLISRYLPDSRSIGHNKFMVLVDKQGKPQAVLTGSTNWTASGLCTQNNNCLIVRQPKLAARYFEYWHDLKTDTVNAGIPKKAAAVPALQGAKLRKADQVKPALVLLQGGIGTVSMWPSPNTDGLVPKGKKGDTTLPPTPPDMNELFHLIAQAKQAVLLLVFQPGAAGSARSWTIVKQLSEVCRSKPGLFVRGAISDEAEAIEFEAARNNLMDAEMVAPAGMMKDLEPWEKEIYKAGHAIVHDKIAVIDPFSDDCVVVTGSHNLGFKASYNNDENLVIVRGNRRLAEAYATHVADIFEHYRWRWYNKRSAERAAAAAWVKDGSDPAVALDAKYAADNFFHAAIQHDEVGDAWQGRYFDPTRLASLERQFWAGGGQPLLPRAPSPGPGFNSGLTPAEITFRAARAALRKQKKGGLAGEEEEEDGETVRNFRNPANKGGRRKRLAVEKKTAAKKKKR